MGFSGIQYKAKTKEPIRSLNGFYGFNVRLGVVPVKITDFRGFGLSEVKVIATNPTSGIPFESFTNSGGNVYMEMDANTEITLYKDKIVKVVQYNAEASPTYQIDLPFIQNN